MRYNTIIIVLLLFIASCSNDNGMKKQPAKSSAKKTLDEVISSTEVYLIEQLHNPEKKIDTDGLITITDGVSVFKIDQAKIVTGRIDENKSTDAIVPIYILRGNALLEYRHLVLLESEGQYIIAKTMNAIFNIIGIKHRRISAEVSTISPDSPAFGCNECREIIQYQYVNGDLVKVE